MVVNAGQPHFQPHGLRADEDGDAHREMENGLVEP